MMKSSVVAVLATCAASKSPFVCRQRKAEYAEGKHTRANKAMASTTVLVRVCTRGKIPVATDRRETQHGEVIPGRVGRPVNLMNTHETGCAQHNRNPAKQRQIRLLNRPFLQGRIKIRPMPRATATTTTTIQMPRKLPGHLVKTRPRRNCKINAGFAHQPPGLRAMDGFDDKAPAIKPLQDRLSILPAIFAK